VGTALGSAVKTTASITVAGGQQQYGINVPAGSTSLSVRIGNASDNGADLDLYLFNCTAGCVLAASSTGATAEEFVSVPNPTAGLWVSLVDPYAIPAGTTTYDYSDVIANPAYGAVTITDPPALHGYGATWSVTASVTANAAPSAGRFLQGFVQVKSGTSVLGSAEVDLKNVAP